MDEWPLSTFRLISLNTRMATDEDADLPSYDHTKLSNINVCPTWGILRYSRHKRMPSSSRQLPLEAGTAAHEAFAAVRLYQYENFQCEGKIQRANVEKHGIRMFGDDRYSCIRNVISDGASDRTNVINYALEALESGEYYDDIGDRQRTISNISESLIAFVDAYDMTRYPIWIRDKEDVDTDIGIEIAFDIVVTIVYEMDGEERTLIVRFTGKLDGLHWNHDNLIIIEEKTGSKLDDHWLAQWILSHQITGYCLASSTFTGEPCIQAIASGMRIPIGKIPAEGIRREQVHRSPIMFEKWANWFVTSIEMEQKWTNDILSAPMYTHSCNRYFRSCSFLPLCAADTIEEKQEILDEMEIEEWSPLHD
tara:strand:- start:1182 stop:2276 length:1095 start_codon:yes stop_codon:yes gene_type:complete